MDQKMEKMNENYHHMDFDSPRQVTHTQKFTKKDQEAIKSENVNNFCRLQRRRRVVAKFHEQAGFK